MKLTIKKERGTITPYSDEDYEMFQKLSDAIYTVDIKNLDMRTLKQNNAIHLWCNKIAKMLNANNLYMKGVFGNDIEWSMDLVKTQIVKATIKKVFDIDSTTKLKRKEIDGMIDYVTIAFASKGVEIPPFPSKELWDEIKDKEKECTLKEHKSYLMGHESDVVRGSD